MKTLAEVLWDAKSGKVAKASEKNISFMNVNCIAICCGGGTNPPPCASGEKCK